VAERSNGWPQGEPPTSQRATSPPQPATDLAELVRAHHAAVYRYAYRLCGNATEAEDLTQQTFLIAIRKVHQVREADKACSWLLAVVRSCFLKSIRKLRPVAVGGLEETPEGQDLTPELDEVDRERLTAAVADLPDEFRVVVLMFYFEELSYKEIASELEIPIGTVMSRLSRAKGHLRRKLAAVRHANHPLTPNPSPTRGEGNQNGNGVGKTAPLRVNP
jgi:RNA polymerase sigma-70 factor (ECF subfamily)